MKKLKAVLSILMAAGVMMLFSSCCCLRCHNLVQNGSFEKSQKATTANGSHQGFIEDNWQSTPSGNLTLLVINADGANSAPNLPIDGRFFNTPCGHQSVSIQGASPSDVASISQTIATNLIANKTYCLSFLQSAAPFVATSAGWSQVPGVIQVQLASSSSPWVNILPNSTFFVQTNTAWTNQRLKFKVPVGGSGNYTLTFSSVAANAIYEHGTDQNGETVAYLDGVRLCKKPWWVLW